MGQALLEDVAHARVPDDVANLACIRSHPTSRFPPLRAQPRQSDPIPARVELFQMFLQMFLQIASLSLVQYWSQAIWL
jgi:hypothetical protein